MTTGIIPYTHNFIMKVKCIISFKLIVFLLVLLVSFLAGTVFDKLQISLELILIVFLFFLIRRLVSVSELIIFCLLIIVSFFSFLNNDILVFLLNLKIFLIPLLIIIYFKNKILSVFVINIFFILNLFIVLYQYIFKQYIINVSGFISLSFIEFTESRPLGLFLNFHFSSYFTAICLIYYLKLKSFKFKLLGLPVLLMSGSFFTALSYLLSILAKNTLFLLAAVIFIIYINLEFMDILILLPKFSSFSIILYQIFDSDRYRVLEFFPQDYAFINLTWYKIIDYNFYNSRNIILENEIQYFTYIIQGGFLFCFVFFVYFFKKVPDFYFFFLVSMFHYGYALNPLIVLLTIVFQNSLNSKNKNE